MTALTSLDAEMAKRQHPGQSGLDARRLHKTNRRGKKQKESIPPENRCKGCHKVLDEVEGTTQQDGWRICDNCYNKGNGLLVGKM